MPSLVLGSARAQFTITLSVAATEPVSVDWMTKDGTALAGRDYEANSGTVVFAPGETSKTVEVFVHGRTVETEDRVFYVLMTPPVNAILADEVGACVIHVDTTGSAPVMTVVIPKGEKGERGYSAYEIALQNGFVGTEAEWLASLRPSPEELAPLVAPLIDASVMEVTAEGTEAEDNPDTDMIKGFAGRIAYMARTKKAKAAPLLAGDNMVPMGAFTGEAVSPMAIGFNVVVWRGGNLVAVDWEYLPETSEIKIVNAQAGDIPLALQQDIGAGGISKAPVTVDGTTKQLQAWIAGLADADQALSDLVAGEVANLSEGLEQANKKIAEIVSVLSFVQPEDSDDITPALFRALDAGSKVVFPYRPEGYDVNAIRSKTLTADKIIDFGGNEVRFTGGQIILKGEVVATGRLLQSFTQRYATQLLISNAAGIQQGDLMFISANVAPSSEWGDTKKDLVRIKSVSGFTLQLEEPMNFAYDTGDAGLTIDIYRPHKLTLEGVKFPLMDAATSSPRIMFSAYYLRDVTVKDYALIGLEPFDPAANIYRTGIQLWKCWGGDLVRGQFDRMSYPVEISGGSRNIDAVGVRARWCHHTIEPGDWASGVNISGVRGSDNFQAISSHPAFDVHYDDFRTKRESHISNLRTVGGSLRNGRIHTIADDSAGYPQFQSIIMKPEYEYLHDDADLDIDGVKWDAPNRITLPPVAVNYGRNVTVTNTRAPAFGVSLNGANKVKNLVFGAGNRIGPKNRNAPAAGQLSIRNPIRITVPPMLPAELVSGTYHIDLRDNLVDQQNGHLKAYGQIINSLAGPLSVPVRIHTNAFADSDQSGRVIGKLKLLGTSRHGNSGSFATIEKHFNFYFQAEATSALVFPTTASFVSGRTGQDTEVLDLAISGPTFAGVSQIGANADHYVQIDVYLSGANASPLFSLSYEIELFRVQ